MQSKEGGSTVISLRHRGATCSTEREFIWEVSFFIVPSSLVHNLTVRTNETWRRIEHVGNHDNQDP